VSKNISKIAVIVITLCTVVFMFTASVFAMGNDGIESAVYHTDDVELQNRMQTVVETYPSAFLDENGEGIEYGGATDCLAYARYVYQTLFDKMDYEGLNIPGCNREYRFDNGTICETNTGAQLKSEFDAMNIKFGSMIFYDPASGSSAEHAMIVLSYDEESVTVIHGSWGGKGLIRVTEFTWPEMISNFGQLAWVRTPWDYPGEETVLIESMEIVGPKNVFIGYDARYSVIINPENATNSSVIWEVENVTGKAQINNKGELIAIEKGIVRITATSRDMSGVSVTQTVRIGKPSDILSVNITKKNGNIIVLDWEKCPTASGYMIYRSDKANGEYVPVSTVVGGSNCRFEDIVEGGTYYYKVRSYEVHYGNLTSGERSLFVTETIKSEIDRSGLTRQGSF